MKRNIITLILSSIAIMSSCQLKRYEVEITYCDKREADTIIVDDFDKPSNSEISTYKQAVPEWNGRLNVCNIRVLSCKNIK